MARPAPAGAPRRDAARRAPERRGASPRRPLRVVPGARRRGGRHGARAALVVAVAMVLASLLAVVGLQAYLTQGQVTLARLQQQQAAEITQHRGLELRVAQLEDPSEIVSEAQRDGLVAPTQVGDLPQVPLGSASTTGHDSGHATSPVVPAPAGSTTASTQPAPGTTR